MTPTCNMPRTTSRTSSRQIENMITKGVNVLVIAAIDGTTLSNALENAAAAGIKVIAYDRLIRDSANVDYYATFDNFKVGVLQANSLVAGLKERFPDAKPWNVELFGGSPDDNNAFFFYNGAMSVLQPMIDAGDIAIPSGQMGMDKVGTLRWDGAVAQARMDNLLSANYGDKQINGALTPYDGLSIGILSSLKGVGYGSGDLKMPIVTGQDAEVPSVKSILAGEQYSTIFKDTRELAGVTVKMVDALLSGGEAPRSTTPRPTTTASRWCRPTCSSRMPVDAVELGRNAGRLGLLHAWTRSSKIWTRSAIDCRPRASPAGGAAHGGQP